MSDRIQTQDFEVPIDDSDNESITSNISHDANNNVCPLCNSDISDANILDSTKCRGLCGRWFCVGCVDVDVADVNADYFCNRCKTEMRQNVPVESIYTPRRVWVKRHKTPHKAFRWDVTTQNPAASFSVLATPQMIENWKNHESTESDSDHKVVAASSTDDDNESQEEQSSSSSSSSFENQHMVDDNDEKNVNSDVDDDMMNLDVDNKVINQSVADSNVDVVDKQPLAVQLEQPQQLNHASQIIPTEPQSSDDDDTPLESKSNNRPTVFPYPMSGQGKGKGGKGKGKYSAKRHRLGRRKAAVDGITKPDIRRLARKGGVKRISGNVYNLARHVLSDFVRSVLQDAATYTEYARRKTVTAMDVVFALRRQNKTLYGFD